MVQSEAGEHHLCPSSTGDTPNAQIIGFIGKDGIVGAISTPIALTDELRLSVGPQPERMFRIASPCTASECANWENQECGLIGRMRQEFERQRATPETAGPLPRCGIRGTCVWWRQIGPNACQVCPHVVYNPAP